jgi:outer membrane protein
VKVQAVLIATAMSAGLAMAQAPTKVGIIHVQQAILSTRDGQKAAAELTGRFDPKRKEIDAKQSEIAALQQELSKGSNTMAEAKRNDLQRTITSKTTSLNRFAQDAEEEFQAERNKVLNELGQKLLVVIDKYARDNAYSLILDVSSQETPVLFAASGVDITKEIVDLYDKNAPSTIPPAPGAAKPPASAAPKPPPAAPPKK